jgi:hypothetical protein
MERESAATCAVHPPNDTLSAPEADAKNPGAKRAAAESKEFEPYSVSTVDRDQMEKLLMMFEEMQERCEKQRIIDEDRFQRLQIKHVRALQELEASQRECAALLRGGGSTQQQDPFAVPTVDTALDTALRIQRLQDHAQALSARRSDQETTVKVLKVLHMELKRAQDEYLTEPKRHGARKRATSDRAKEIEALIDQVKVDRSLTAGIAVATQLQQPQVQELVELLRRQGVDLMVARAKIQHLEVELTDVERCVDTKQQGFAAGWSAGWSGGHSAAFRDLLSPPKKTVVKETIGELDLASEHADGGCESTHESWEEAWAFEDDAADSQSTQLLREDTLMPSAVVETDELLGKYSDEMEADVVAESEYLGKYSATVPGVPSDCIIVEEDLVVKAQPSLVWLLFKGLPNYLAI